MSTSSILTTLPPELQRGILDLLPYPTLQVMHATHPNLRSMIDLEHRRASLHPATLFTQLLTASLDDPFRQFNAHYPCNDCLRLRPGDKYPDKMKRKHWFRRHRWFCIDCGLDQRYAPGVMLHFDNVPAVWCKRCKGFITWHETVVRKPGAGERLHSLLCCKHYMISELWLDTVVPTGGTCKPCHQQHKVEEDEKMQPWHRQLVGENTEGQSLRAWMVFENHWKELLEVKHGGAWKDKKGRIRKKVWKANKIGWPDSVKFKTVVKFRGIMPDDLMSEDERLESILESVRSLFI